MRVLPIPPGGGGQALPLPPGGGGKAFACPALGCVPSDQGDTMSGHPVIARRGLLAAACALPFTRVLAAAPAAATIRIGQCLPLTGPLGPVVKPIAEGQ